jgi:hypothetical protein
VGLSLSFGRIGPYTFRVRYYQLWSDIGFGKRAGMTVRVKIPYVRSPQ